jgi:peptide/nickel transport system substrate-binding protein
MTPGVGAAATRGAVRSRVVLSLAAAVLALAAALTCTRGVGAEPAAELRVGVTRLPDPLDPVAPMGPSAGVVFRHIFQGLVEIGERGDIVPALATQWSVSRDGLTWTFRLRPDVQFHNGVPLTADVVVGSLGRLPTGDEAATREAAEPWLGLFRGRNAVVREVRRGEAGSVQIVLAQPYSPLLAALAHPALAVVVTERDSQVPVLGTGPYRVTERSATRLVLEAVASAAEPPRVARLVFEEVTDDAAALAELAPGGRLDVHFPRVPPPWGGLGLQVLSGPTWQLGILALRTHEGLASRKAVRRAIATSLDPALVGPALGRMARPYAGYLPPLAWAVRPPPPTVHDPIRARRLLAESGSAGASLTLLVPEARDELEPARIAEALRLSLAVAGLTVKVRSEPPAAYEPALRNGEGELALTEVALPLDDPHYLLRPLVASDAAPRAGATNVAFYRNPVTDGLLLRGSQLGFRPERLRLYHRLQAQLAEDLPYIPLYVRLQWAVSRPGVRDLRLDPNGRHRLDRVRLPSPPAPPAPPADAPPPR